MDTEIIIRNKKIGKDNPIFIIAECGVTCNYDMTITKELIKVVKESGADAIKFIFWFPEEIMSDKTIIYTYETISGIKSENMYEMLKKMTFSLDEWFEIKAYADKNDVILFATVNSPSGIEYAERLGLEAYKLSSWDFNYFSLWKRIAALGKPMLIDTGPVNTLDVAKVIKIMRDANNYKSVLLHCFHTDKYEEMNMKAIPYMQRTFNTIVGYSSRDQNDEMDIMAISLGAVVLEKRLTLSRSLPGHHHILSKEPKEFEKYVKLIRDLHKALGIYDLKPSETDMRERSKWFRHVVANRDIPKGTILTRDMLEAKRPEKGISPEYIDFLIGRELKRDKYYNEPILWEDI
jgi:N-acetylneuraminate synthase/N,N'-diacetyllegionaminate synthase